MSTELTWQTTSTSLEETSQLASEIGRRLRGGEVIALASDLGGGKTTFTRALVIGAGSHDVVRSPSFTLSNEYQADDLRIYHFDFYRLNEAGVLRNELAECLDDPHGVVVVEWADIVEDVLPLQKLNIIIETTGEIDRNFNFQYPANWLT